MSLIDELPKPEKDNGVIDFAGITKILPHRYPFLMIDNVISYEKENKIICQKNVSFNEPYFQGHFPEDPVMPGVMQVEAMAQAGCILMYLSYEDIVKGKRPAFMGVKECRFRKPVRPGDVLRIESEIVSFRRMIATMKSEVYVNDVLVSDCISMATMV
jgi:3-hydroxyacyl-[acyl-carrier-protein] dehydratase